MAAVVKHFTFINKKRRFKYIFVPAGSIIKFMKRNICNK